MPATPTSTFAWELRKWWSFDDRQQHTHSWHSREDFIERRLPEILSIYACAVSNAEIERLRLENWQLKGALGYPVPGDIPQGDFKCGLCEARSVAAAAQFWKAEEVD